VNGLEDIRCEMRLCQIGAGLLNAKQMLAALTQYTTARAVADGWNPQDPASLSFTLYSYAATARDMLAMDVPSMPDFAAVLAPAQLALVREVMARVRKCANTLDVL